MSWYANQNYPTKYVELPDLGRIETNIVEHKYVVDLLNPASWADFHWVKCTPGVFYIYVHIVICLKCILSAAVVGFLFVGLVDVSGVVNGMAAVAGLMEADRTIPGV